MNSGPDYYSGDVRYDAQVDEELDRRDGLMNQTLCSCRERIRDLERQVEELDDRNRWRWPEERMRREAAETERDRMSSALQTIYRWVTSESGVPGTLRERIAGAVLSAFPGEGEAK